MSVGEGRFARRCCAWQWKLAPLRASQVQHLLAVKQGARAKPGEVLGARAAGRVENDA